MHEERRLKRTRWRHTSFRSLTRYVSYHNQPRYLSDAGLKNRPFVSFVQLVSRRIRADKSGMKRDSASIDIYRMERSLSAQLVSRQWNWAGSERVMPDIIRVYGRKRVDSSQSVDLTYRRTNDSEKSRLTAVGKENLSRERVIRVLVSRYVKRKRAKKRNDRIYVWCLTSKFVRLSVRLARYRMGDESRENRSIAISTFKAFRSRFAFSWPPAEEAVLIFLKAGRKRAGVVYVDTKYPSPSF